MNVTLAYGQCGLEIDLNDKYHISKIESEFVRGLSSPIEKIRESLSNPYDSLPLGKLIADCRKVGIIFSDITRPVPSKLIITTIIEEITNNHNVEIVLFNALGSHRENTDEELKLILGQELMGNYHIVQNDAFAIGANQYFGISSYGNQIYLNREMASCDLLILTGLIEPHFFAGFSGGGKSIMPGMGGIETILGNHNSKMIGNRNAKYGVTNGNPIWEEILEISSLFSNIFLVNITMNRDKEITGVFSGNIRSAHKAGCEFLRYSNMVPVNDLFDIVITTNSGFPLDLNLYQAVKGMCSATPIIKRGGDIIIAAECRDGLPDYGFYSKILSSYKNPKEALHSIISSNETVHDQWQVQIQTQIQLMANIHVYSENLSDKQIQSVHLIPCRNIENTIEKLLKNHQGYPKIAIIPEGPQTIPYLEREF